MYKMFLWARSESHWNECFSKPNSKQMEFLTQGVLNRVLTAMVLVCYLYTIYTCENEEKKSFLQNTKKSIFQARFFKQQWPDLLSKTPHFVVKYVCDKQILPQCGKFFDKNVNKNGPICLGIELHRWHALYNAGVVKVSRLYPFNLRRCSFKPVLSETKILTNQYSRWDRCRRDAGLKYTFKWKYFFNSDSKQFVK